ncbi:YCII-related domain-containing protein [Rhizobium mongolense subsp. loessense]|uniref:YCII-related domain-containing protein n=1 Tax=Rhizobium mongolense subsp. loessense TaxID=158890 RepID=A0A1G4SR94_9HYPH|nr:YciI family protein [Rhizobium mongolense]SCW71734.1 YCII-related domain-containing protein [Rhizobium mongolense subsp. loessense]
MAYFFLRLVPPRSRFPNDATGEEMAAMERHAEYWRHNAQEGSAIAVGPVFEGEGAWGMAVVSVEDREAAKALADADPIVRSSFGFHFEILPMPSIILRPSAAGNE